MSWIYVQCSGEVYRDEVLRGCGYSGAGTCKNVPTLESLHNRGPIPRGLYQILPPRDSAQHGPYVLPLMPNAENKMFGRGGFLIHGDSANDPGTASQGCVILPRVLRHLMWESGDHELQVIADLSAANPETTKANDTV